MNSRERVRAVLNHQIPDRVPNGLGGCETSGLHVIAYDNLQNMLGVERKPPKVNSSMAIAVFEEPVIRAIQGDTILLASPKLCESEFRGDVAAQWKEQKLWGRTFSVPATVHLRENSDGTLTWESSMWDNGAVCPHGGYYFEHREESKFLEDFEVPDPDEYQPCGDIDERELRRLENAAKQLYEETDLSICLGEVRNTLQAQPGGLANYMVLMLEEPDIMREILDKYVEAALKEIQLLDQAVGKYVDMLSIAHDIGDNRGVTIGAGLWRDIYKPAYRKLFQGWRRITDMKINFHSCGSIDSIMGDLIECGAHIINPIQTSAANMSASSLKEAFGKDVVFWGGAYDAQLIPYTASYEEVYRSVCNNIKILAAGGNYIFSGVHNLPANIPEHHLKAMLDAYSDARMYETF